jgi:hypothetical protein
MRCAGEIDITRPRGANVPHARALILDNVKNFAPGEASGASSKDSGGREEGTGTARAPARVAGRRSESRRDQADDRPAPDVRRLSEYPKYAMSAATSSTSRP